MPVYSPIMLALCSMLLVTYYASNYAGIISLGLLLHQSFGEFILKLKVEGYRRWGRNKIWWVFSVVVFCPDCTMFLCRVQWALQAEHQISWSWYCFINWTEVQERCHSTEGKDDDMQWAWIWVETLLWELLWAIKYFIRTTQSSLNIVSSSRVANNTKCNTFTPQIKGIHRDT